jgi:Flp pilus assembly protein TadB
MQNPFEMRVADAELAHVLQRIADVVDRGAALSDALRDEARAPVQVELVHVGRMRRVGEKRERADLASSRD